MNRDLGTQSDLKQFTIVNIDAHSITTVLYDHPTAMVLDRLLLQRIPYTTNIYTP